MTEFELMTDPLTEEKGFIQIVKLQLNIRNFENRLLVANPDTNAATFETYADAEDEKATFFLVIYKMLSGEESGLPVAVSCTVDGIDYLLSVENNSVTLKESEVPDLIQSESSEFIFHLRGEVTSSTTLESSEEPGLSLASSEDSGLVLKPHSEEEPEITAKLVLGPLKNVENSSRNIQKKVPYKFWNIEVDVPGSSLESIPDFEQLGDIAISDLLNVFKPTVSAKIIPYYIQNHSKDFLVADPEKAIVSFESNGHEKDEQATFYVNICRIKGVGVSDGLPVVLSCKVHNNNYLVCAASESVILKLTELPSVIEEQTELIFYLKEFSPGHSSTRLEPLADRKLSIACNLSEKKLILKKHNDGEIDETMEFMMADKTKNTQQA